MKLSQYGYEFEPEMLAKYPAENRDESRLMVIDRAKGTVEHRIFKDLLDYFDERDLFLFNDTKVFPARLYGNKGEDGRRHRNLPAARAQPRPASVGRAG